MAVSFFPKACLLLLTKYYVTHSIQGTIATAHEGGHTVKIERELMRGAGPVAVLKLLEEEMIKTD